MGGIQGVGILGLLDQGLSGGVGCIGGGDCLPAHLCMILGARLRCGNSVLGSICCLRRSAGCFIIIIKSILCYLFYFYYCVFGGPSDV